jgi:hypothetical protein
MKRLGYKKSIKKYRLDRSKTALFSLQSNRFT